MDKPIYGKRVVKTYYPLCQKVNQCMELIVGECETTLYREPLLQVQANEFWKPASRTPGRYHSHRSERQYAGADKFKRPPRYR